MIPVVRRLPKARGVRFVCLEPGGVPDFIQNRSKLSRRATVHNHPDTLLSHNPTNLPKVAGNDRAPGGQGLEQFIRCAMSRIGIVLIKTIKDNVSKTRV